MNKKQLIVACIVLALLAIIPFSIWAIRSVMEEYGYFTLLEWLIFGLPILIIGGLLIYFLRDKKQTELMPLMETSRLKIKRIRQILLMFFLLWSASAVWGLHLQHNESDLSNLPLGQLTMIWLVKIVGLICLPMTSIYVYKLYKWYNSPKAPALAMTIIYVIFWFIFPLVPILIILGIIWKSRELLVKK